MPLGEAGAVSIPADPRYSDAQRRVLQGAVECFFERGFHATTMREIAARVGIQAASIYEHFPSKDGVLAAVIDMARQDMLPRVTGAVAEAGDDPADQLRAMVTEWVASSCTNPELAIVVTQEYRSLPPELSADAIALDSGLRYTLAGIVVRGITFGAFANRNLVLGAAAVGSVCIRTPYWFVPFEGYGPDEFGRDMAEIALSIVNTPMTGPNPL